MIVLGAGAIGSLLGGLLSEVGLDVTLVGRQAHTKAIRSRGLHISGVVGSKTIRIESEASASAIKGKADMILCTVKAYDTEQAATDAKTLMGKDSIFLCMQNGLGVENEAAKVLGEANVTRGVTNTGALLVKPGYIECTGVGDTIVGCPNEDWKPKISGLVEALNSAGLPAMLTRNISNAVWTKVLVNVGINAIGAITRLKNGDLLSNPYLKDLMRSAVTEALAVSEKAGLNLKKEDIVEKTFKIAEATAANKNSMLQDAEKGKRTEIDFINGAVARIGKSIGIPTPINDTLTALVKGAESRALRNET